MADTLLTLTGMGVPDYSARGLTQTITPIKQALNVARSINGVLINFAPSSFQKYRTEIMCTDQQTPAIDGIWPGSLVTIHSACELSYATGGSPARAVVSGSSRTEGGFTFYRPVLDVMILEIEDSFAEWEADYAWKIVAEEV